VYGVQIGIVGSGRIGQGLAEHLVGLGHTVAISNSRGPESLSGLVDDLGANARASTVAEAAAFGPLVVEAIPFGAYDSLPAEALAGRTVVSAANYYPDRDGDVDLEGRAHTELVAAHLPESAVVKAFNTMYFETLRDEARPDAPVDERLTLFLAGDDAAAKATVADLIEAIGFAPLDVGSLADSTVMEPGSPIHNDPMRPADARATLDELRGG
jgi:predicted dinucleotide-binding enzyme